MCLVQSRYWTDEEHSKFVEGMKLFGAKDAKKIAKHVGTRDSTQVRSHAQKYFIKLAQERGEESARGSRGIATNTSSSSASSTSSDIEANTKGKLSVP